MNDVDRSFHKVMSRADLHGAQITDVTTDKDGHICIEVREADGITRRVKFWGYDETIETIEINPTLVTFVPFGDDK